MTIHQGPELLAAMLILQDAADRANTDHTLPRFERWQAVRMLYHAQLHILGIEHTRNQMGGLHPWSKPYDETH